MYLRLSIINHKIHRFFALAVSKEIGAVRTDVPVPQGIENAIVCSMNLNRSY